MIMTEQSRKRPHDSVRAVLGFAFRHWAAQKLRIVTICAFVCIGVGFEVLMPMIAGRLVDALAAGDRPGVPMLFAAMVALGIGTVVARHVSIAVIVPFTLKMMSDVAEHAFRRVQRFSTDWHANSFAGSVVRKITRGMWAIDMLNDVALIHILGSFVVLLGTMLLLGMHWPLVGLVMGLGATAYVVLTVLLATRWVAPASTLSNAWDTRMGGLLSDAIGCNAVVKAFGAETREEDRFAHLVDKWRSRTRRTWVRSTWSGTMQLTLLWGLRTLVVGAAVWLWWQGHATPGDVTYVLTSYFVLHGHLADIGYHVHHLQRAVNEMEELVEIHAQPLGIDDRADSVSIDISTGEVCFEGVTFRYGAHSVPLYDDLSVTIRGGERVGLVGQSGSGKTSFVKLIQRLYDVTGGRVMIDGQDVSHATQQSLRAQIAIVQQEPILFHRSLADNIAYARPGATQKEIERAAQLANAHDFIARLPKGYATLVGERGVKLSGGERQRVALARAFLADAPILILDEATSSLDSESEALIQQAMERLMQGRTAIVIAHRLSTVRTLDRILVFDQGRIVEDGDHATLLADPAGRYRRLFDRQSGAVRDEPEFIDA